MCKFSRGFEGGVQSNEIGQLCFHFLDRLTLMGVSNGLGFCVEGVPLGEVRLRSNIGIFLQRLR